MYVQYSNGSNLNHQPTHLVQPDRNVSQQQPEGLR